MKFLYIFNFDTLWGILKSKNIFVSVFIGKNKKYRKCQTSINISRCVKIYWKVYLFIPCLCKHFVKMSSTYLSNVINFWIMTIQEYLFYRKLVLRKNSGFSLFCFLFPNVLKSSDNFWFLHAKSTDYVPFSIKKYVNVDDRSIFFYYKPFIYMDI